MGPTWGQHPLILSRPKITKLSSIWVRTIILLKTFFLCFWDPVCHNNNTISISTAERLGEAKPRGLARTQIDQLPSYRFSGEIEEGGQSTCVICMCEFETRQTLRVLPCSHEYHAKCIDKWLKVLHFYLTFVLPLSYRSRRY